MRHIHSELASALPGMQDVSIAKAECWLEGPVNSTGRVDLVFMKPSWIDMMWMM